MFARSSSVNAQPSRIDAGIAHVRDTVVPTMSHLDGFVGLSLMVNRDTGLCIATSAWRTREAMWAGSDRVAAIRDAAAEIFGAGMDVEEWEIAVMHRAHHARPGTCMRGTWIRNDPARMDEAVDSFKFTTLAKVEDLPGFCSASLLVDRDTGRAVVTIGYDDRDALERSREAADEVRAKGAQAAAVEVIGVAEFDLVIGRLHVPETV